jgi:hypothetical protein
MTPRGKRKAQAMRMKVGDSVKIKVNALWRNRPTVWRKVKSIQTDRNGDQYITVGLGGWPHYIVRDAEIIEGN